MVFDLAGAWEIYHFGTSMGNELFIMLSNNSASLHRLVWVRHIVVNTL
jgi:hypothetical protein